VSLHTTTCPTVSGFTSRLKGARVLPRVPWCQLPAQGNLGAATCLVVPATGSGQLGCRHMSCSTSSHLSVRDSSGAATCLVMPAPTSQLEAAQVPLRVPGRQLPPHGLGQLGCHNMSHDTLQTTGYQSIRIFPGGITIVISYWGVHVSSKMPLDKAGVARLQGV
jgi:hypothetical protein